MSENDFTIGEMETMVAMFFGVEPMSIAHVAVTIQTVNGMVRTIGCAHCKELAAMTLKMEEFDGMANQAPHSHPHNVGNVDSSPGYKRKGRMARIMSYLQFRARIRY